MINEFTHDQYTRCPKCSGFQINNAVIISEYDGCSTLDKTCKHCGHNYTVQYKLKTETILISPSLEDQ